MCDMHTLMCKSIVAIVCHIVGYIQICENMNSSFIDQSFDFFKIYTLLRGIIFAGFAGNLSSTKIISLKFINHNAYEVQGLITNDPLK